MVVIIIIGALLGGKSFGETVRKGCGFLMLLVIIAIGIFFYSRTDLKKTPEDQEVISTVDNSVHFVVKENCQTYIKPNIESASSRNLEMGKDYFVEDINKFNYFYEITNKNGKKLFIREECLKRK